jgi:hypothetical protein
MVGPLKIGGDQWNALVEVASAFANQVMGDLLPRIADIGMRVQMSKSNAERVAIAGESNRAIMTELMVAMMCGFKLAISATVVRESPEGVIEFQIEHPEARQCQRTNPSA